MSNKVGKLVLLTPLLLLAGWVFAVPPPVQQFSADCSAPVYASDQLVCADEQLLRLDTLMVEYLSSAETPLAVDEAVANQVQWFQHSRMCAFEPQHRECLLREYCERLIQLTCDMEPANPDLRNCFIILQGQPAVEELKTNCNARMTQSQTARPE